MEASKIIRVSVTEATRDFQTLLAQVQSGAEIIIESDSTEIARIQPATETHRSIEDSIRRAEAWSKELGFTPTLDAGLAADIEEIVRNRKPRHSTAWD